MILRKLFGTLTLSSLIASSALASGEVPDPAHLLSAKTVSVLPVLTSGPRAAAYQRLEATLASAPGATAASAVRPGELVALDASAGFGFAGASTDADIAILRLAFLVGAIPASEGKELASMIATYERARDSLAPLTPELVAAADHVIEAARSGRVDAHALTTAMRLAEEGISTGPARAHGYFATGLWFGLSAHVVSSPRADSAFTSMAGPLAVMLEEDAEFGGSDLALATELRKVAAMLVSGGVDLAQYRRSVATAMAVGADAR